MSHVCCMFSVGVSPHDELLGQTCIQICLNKKIIIIKKITIRTGPVNRCVFAIHTGLSLFLKLK